MILGVIVTYNPNLHELNNNILSIINQVDKLILFDNSSENAEEIRKQLIYPELIFIYKNVNVGLGAAYNEVIKNYISEFDFFVTFDQDTNLSNNCINSLIELFNINQKIGIVGPNYSKNNVGFSEDYYIVDTLIQSCSIFKKETILKVGLFDEYLFIDSVDFDYCLKAQLKGYKIVRSNKILMNHTIGQQRFFLGRSFTEHNTLRYFYMARNNKIIFLRYALIFPRFVLKKNFFFVLHLLKLIFIFRRKDYVYSTFLGLLK